MLSEESVVFLLEVEEYLRSYLIFFYDYWDKYFGNVCIVCNVVNEAIKNYNLCLVVFLFEVCVNIFFNFLIFEDVEFFKFDKSSFVFNKKFIGFKCGEG